METKYEYESGSQTLTRITTVEAKRRDEKGKETEETFFVREYKDTFAGKKSRDQQIKALKSEEEKAKQAVNNLKAQVKVVGTYEANEELDKLEKQLQELQARGKKKELADNLAKSEKLLKDLRDELSKVRMVVPETDRI